ncbi:MAG: response regulator [Oligoflexales bacterium]|nr:response regulator [Oligoflexales bacterium]
MKPGQGVSKKIFLLDDDPTYLLIMQRAAEMEGIELDIYSSFHDIRAAGALNSYDGAIIDYDLESVTGIEICEYLSSMKHSIPLVMVSRFKTIPKNRKLPENVKLFIPKSAGYQKVLKAVAGINE